MLYKNRKFKLGYKMGCLHLDSASNDVFYEKKYHVVSLTQCKTCFYQAKVEHDKSWLSIKIFLLYLLLLGQMLMA